MPGLSDMTLSTLFISPSAQLTLTQRKLAHRFLSPPVSIRWLLHADR
jgi:hypothetical protein